MSPVRRSIHPSGARESHGVSRSYDLAHSAKSVGTGAMVSLSCVPLDDVYVMKNLRALSGSADLSLEGGADAIASVLRSLKVIASLSNGRAMRSTNRPRRAAATHCERTVFAPPFGP